MTGANAPVTELFLRCSKALLGEPLRELLHNKHGEDGVNCQNGNENDMLEQIDGSSFGGAEQQGEDLLLQQVDHHRMVQVNSVGHLAAALEDFPVQQLVDPGFGFIHGQQQKYKGDQVNVVVAIGNKEGKKGKNGCQIEQQLFRPDELIIGSGGEVIDQNTDAQRGEGPQQRDVEEYHRAPDVITGSQKCLNHQNGGREDEFSGQLFVLEKQSVDKITADDQGAQLPERIIGAAAEETCILQKEKLGNGSIHIFHDHHDLVCAGLAQEGNNSRDKGIHRQDDQGEDVMGIQ